MYYCIVLTYICMIDKHYQYTGPLIFEDNYQISNNIEPRNYQHKSLVSN